jgi:hypothetical protein
MLYLTMLFSARKHGGCYAWCMLLPDAFGPGPLGPRLCRSWSLCPPQREFCTLALFHQSALERTELEVEYPARRQQEHSAYRTAMMARISPKCRYNLSTPTAEAGSNVFRSVATTATF